MSEKMLRRARLGAVLVAIGAGALAGCQSLSHEPSSSSATDETDPSVNADDPSQDADTAYPDDRVEPAVVRGLRTGTPQEVLVTFDDSSTSSIAMTRLGHTPQTADEYAMIAALRSEAIASLRTEILNKVGKDRVFATRTYQHVPVFLTTLQDMNALASVLDQRNVLAIEHVAQFHLTDAQSSPLINQPAAQSAGRTGAGTTVAVLDTGAKYEHADFGSCSAPGGTCKIAYAADFATEDNNHDDNGHGTNVSSIVLQVAPGARVAALDVFAGSLAYTTDVVAAIDWTIANRATYNIVAINMSLGGGSYTAPCSTGAFPTAISSARTAGILSVVASGNNGYTNAISSPACSPAAISVGAVYDSNVGGLGFSVCTDATTAADKVTCFSNSASFLTMLAPGAMIAGGGYTMAGTSQASPHVAGAVAVVRAQFPSMALNDVVTRLTSTGRSITDARQSRVSPRLDVAAASAPDCSVSLSTSTFAPASAGGFVDVTITTDNGCLWMASLDGAWLHLDTTSGTGPATIRLSADASVTGDARVGHLYVEDQTLTVSQGADVTAPSSASVVVNAGASDTTSTTVSLALSATDDVGVSEMCISNTSTCSSWVPYATSSSWTLTSGAGVKTVTAFFRDAHGNVSTAVNDTITLVVVPAGDTTPPANTSVALANGLTVTGALDVTLALSATDDVAVTSMCISESSSSCTTWVPYATRRALRLSAGSSGNRNVYAFFRDAANNVTPSPAMVTIMYDGTSPYDGRASSVAGAGSNVISWSAFRDIHSGIASYKIAFSTSASPAIRCTTGSVAATPVSTASSFEHIGLSAGTTYYYRVCAIDAANNVSSGVAFTGVPNAPAADVTGPTLGSFVIEGGAAWVNRTRVAFTLSASDLSGVTQMAASDVATCSGSCPAPVRGAWVPYATSGFYQLGGTGSRTVTLWLRDALGNESTHQVTVNVDTVRPVAGRVGASGRTASVFLSWSGFSDAQSGIATYKVAFAPSAAPATCDAGTLAYNGTALSTTVTSLTPGAIYGFRVCAIDAAGNESSVTALERAR